MMGTNPSVKFTFDTTEYERAMKDMSQITEQFGSIFADAMKSSIVSGKDFENTLRQIALRISSLALDKAFGPLDSLLSGLASSIFGDVSSAGDTVGPPIDLLRQRTSANAATQVNFTVNSPDSASFRKSQSQIAGMLLRTVQRGQRNQ
jgi:hypothetical protein